MPDGQLRSRLGLRITKDTSFRYKLIAGMVPKSSLEIRPGKLSPSFLLT